LRWKVKLINYQQPVVNDDNAEDKAWIEDKAQAGDKA
jgi:hypothetical protein